MSVTLKFPSKDPEEVLDYPVDFTEWLVTNAGIDNSPAVTVTQEGTSTPKGLTDLIVDQIDISGAFVTVWLSGGTHQNTYIFKIKGTDDQSPERTYVRRFKMKIKER